jgi:hypothetical protein
VACALGFASDPELASDAVAETLALALPLGWQISGLWRFDLARMSIARRPPIPSVVVGQLFALLDGALRREGNHRRSGPDPSEIGPRRMVIEHPVAENDQDVTVLTSLKDVVHQPGNFGLWDGDRRTALNDLAFSKWPCGEDTPPSPATRHVHVAVCRWGDSVPSPPSVPARRAPRALG